MTSVFGGTPKPHDQPDWFADTGGANVSPEGWASATLVPAGHDPAPAFVTVSMMSGCPPTEEAIFLSIATSQTGPTIRGFEAVVVCADERTTGVTSTTTAARRSLPYTLRVYHGATKNANEGYAHKRMNGQEISVAGTHCRAAREPIDGTRAAPLQSPGLQAQLGDPRDTSENTIMRQQQRVAIECAIPPRRSAGEAYRARPWLSRTPARAAPNGAPRPASR